MNKNRFYVDFHVIQTVPPSCVNRDDTGRPKTAKYGGVDRARVSSQAWKHAIRKMFKEIFDSEDLGLRTKYVVNLISEKMIAAGMNAEKAAEEAPNALKNAGIKINDKKGNTTGALFFISSIQAAKLAELLINGEQDKKAYKNALKTFPSIDMALFGRMVADDVDLNVDAACQVAHSISTHSVQNEYDYFTAVDDFSQLDNAGAGHLGTMEFNSSTLYRYATINVLDLAKTIGADTPSAVAGFAEAFICSMPDGKQNSYANRTLPDLVYVTIRRDQPVNLSGAFENPVSAYKHEGFVRGSKDALFKHAKDVYDNYCGVPERSFIIGDYENFEAEKKNLNELLISLREIVAKEVS